jgi:hypothetical protein
MPDVCSPLRSTLLEDSAWSNGTFRSHAASIFSAALPSSCVFLNVYNDCGARGETKLTRRGAPGMYSPELLFVMEYRT